LEASLRTPTLRFYHPVNGLDTGSADEGYVRAVTVVEKLRRIYAPVAEPVDGLKRMMWKKVYQHDRSILLISCPEAADGKACRTSASE